MDQSRRTFLKKSCAVGAVVMAAPASLNARKTGEISQESVRPSEWRNRSPEMKYRRLGRTGLMVSEVVMGAIGRRELSAARLAIELGLNYFDTAQRYGGGRSEETLGEFLSEPGVRERVFVSTKVSAYLPALDEMAGEILSGLPSEKKKRIRKNALERLERLGVHRSGYHFNYFRDHESELPTAYLTNEVILEYGFQVGADRKLSELLEESLDGSLQRLRTDYLDILHCPHGARLPRELENPVIRSFFENSKKAGKIRFSGLSVHSDVPRVLTRASELGCYDIAMVAYNVANQASMETAIASASLSGMGIVAMKVARAINRPIGGGPVPRWRVEKLNTAIPGLEKPEVKAYAWALNNRNLTAVISAMDSESMVRENLSIPQKLVTLAPV